MISNNVSDSKEPEGFLVGFLKQWAPLIISIFVVIIITILIVVFFKVAKEYERVVISRLGLIKEPARGPGLFFAIPYVDICTFVDMRTMSVEVPSQEILTRDSVSVAVDAVMFYRVREARKCYSMVGNFSESTNLLAATTLRNVLGTRDLGQLLSDRDAINHTVQLNLEDITDGWGIKVERVEIKDIRLPFQLQKAMAAEAEAAREARAKVIAAKGEVRAANFLKEASVIMMENPISLQLRYLQSINAIAGENSKTIIFPFPTDFLPQFLGRPGT